MAILSLCSGVGMLDVAVEHITGEKTAYVAEKDPAAAAVLAMRFPQASNLGDIEGFDWAAWAADHPEITVIAAGFSCQDISNAGPREGISGSRSSVWKDVARAVGHVRPRVAFLENVGAIRSRGINVVAEDLAEVGYDLRWTTLRASDVGAAHQRLRWFGVATPHVPDASGVGRPERWAEPAEQQGRLRRPAGNGGEPVADPDHVGRDGRSRDEPAPEGRDEPADGSRSPAEWWGEYLPAIRRWEVITGAPAPMPTEIGPRGGRRLAASFAEWLMGWPAGWVTDVPGVKRADQLKCIGNGVVPLQAIAAYRSLMED